MHYDEFIQQVQEKASLDSRERAQEITEATLQTLGERLDGTSRQKLASQLSGELKEYVLKRDERSPERYGLQEFYNRVGARIDSGYQDAAERAKAVMAVLQAAVSEGQLEQVINDLPDEYRRLIEPKQAGPGSPSLES